MLTTIFSGPGSETFEVIGLMVAALVVVYLLLRFFQASRPSKTGSSRERWVLIDGSNVMHWQDNKPQLTPVLHVIKHLTALGYAPGVVFDANAGWKLEGRYLHERDFAQRLKLKLHQVLVVPKGTQADPFLLETAKAFHAPIVTNDRFRDWAEAHPKVREPGFLIRGGYRSNGEFWLAETTPLNAATKVTA